MKDSDGTDVTAQFEVTTRNGELKVNTATMTVAIVGNSDTDEVYDGTDKDPFESTMCITINPKSIPDPSRVVHIKPRQAFSLIYHGDNDYIMENGGKILLEEMKKRNLKPAGPLYGINIVGIFFGHEIDPDDYVFRFAIPI